MYESVSVCIEEITPEKAALYKEKILLQRKTSTVVIDRYSSDMKSGVFRLSDSAICFDSDGNCLNGLHRLNAVIKSGATIWAIVARNVPHECMRNFDQGFGRRIYHGLQMAGVDFANTRICAMVYQAEAGVRKTKRRMTVDQVLGFMDRHQGAISFVTNAVATKKQKGISRAGFTATLLRGWYHVDEPRLQRFVDIVEGAAFESHETAASALGRWLLQQNGKTDTVTVFGASQSALRAFIDDEPRSLTRPRVDRNLFELPEESRRS